MLLLWRDLPSQYRKNREREQWKDEHDVSVCGSLKPRLGCCGIRSLHLKAWPSVFGCWSHRQWTEKLSFHCEPPLLYNIAGRQLQTPMSNAHTHFPVVILPWVVHHVQTEQTRLFLKTSLKPYFCLRMEGSEMPVVLCLVTFPYIARPLLCLLSICSFHRR